ncbi:MAG: tetratricopeptide repeat protein, partial [Anaerolineales bacterium]|nr:tetratricopeptide repeat protein [Anaerolineales bacterium]
LQLYEEWVFDVRGLTVPTSDTPEEAKQASAVQLFLQTAHRARRDFTPTPSDLAAIVAVCRALEGMPLGIELAAAWIRHLSCADVAHQLTASNELLTTSLRNVPARHRSVTAVFDHSWQLLRTDEQAGNARLACFQGSFTAAAAATIALTSKETLQALVDKSLLRRQDERYDMHALLRQFAQEKLTAAEATATAERHADFYLALLNAQENIEETAERQIIQAELPNIRAAWEWTAQKRAYAVLEKSLMMLHRFYSVQSWFQEGIALFAQTLADLTQAEPETAVPAGILCEILSRQARMQIQIGQLEAAKEALDTAVTYLPLIDDPKQHSVVLGYLAMTAYYAGEHERATKLAQESLDLAKQANDIDGAGFATNFLGSCAKAQGKYELARGYFEQAVAIYQQQDDLLGAAMTIHNLGNLGQAMGDYDTAQRHYLTCGRIFKELRHDHGLATTLINAGKLAHKQGNLAQAAAWLHEGVTLKRTLQDERGTAVALCGLGDLAVAQGEYEQAHTYLIEAITLANKSGDVNLVLEGLEVLGVLAHQRGAATSAARLLAFVLIQPGVSQEVKEYASQAQANIGVDLHPDVIAWAQQQTMTELVAQILDGLLPLQAN